MEKPCWWVTLDYFVCVFKTMAQLVSLKVTKKKSLRVETIKNSFVTGILKNFFLVQMINPFIMKNGQILKNVNFLE